MVSPAPFLPLWPETAGAGARLINHSENHTFLVDCGYVLRVHPPSRGGAAIADELGWLRSLRRETGLVIPEQVGGVAEADGRRAVLFRYIPGVEPEPDEKLYEHLGRCAATLHRHAGQGPHRPAWDERLLDADGPWGDWRAMSDDLAGLDAHLRQRLADYGKSDSRFGLIHADMRLANVLADGDRLAIIDFDDCGYGWFMYDFAAAVSFLETDPRLPRFRDAWLRGYQPIRALADADVAILGTMVLFRRMALLTWIGSHAATGLARTHVATFAADTLRLADAWL